MRFEFLEPLQSLQPNLTSAEASTVIPLLKKMSASAYIFFARKGGLVPCEEKNALYVEKNILRMAKIVLRGLISWQL